MTLRGSAILFLFLSAISTVVLVGASAAQFRFYDDLIDRADQLRTAAASSAPVTVTEGKDKEIAAPPGPAVALVVLSPAGERLRNQYYRNGTLIVVEHLGEGQKLVRRDIYDGKKMRVQQFFDQERNPLQILFKDAAGQIIYRKDLPVLVPLPGWQYQ